MELSQLMKGIGETVAATKPPQEYCFLWIDWWPICMSKSEWSGWMQFLGAVLAIAVAFYIASNQLRVERRRDQDLAISLILPFASSLDIVSLKLTPDGTRSIWDMRLIRIMLEAEIKRADSVPVNALSESGRHGLFMYRLLAMQFVEAFLMAEATPENSFSSSTPAAEDFPRVRKDAYDFVQNLIQHSQNQILEAKMKLSKDIKA